MISNSPVVSTGAFWSGSGVGGVLGGSGVRFWRGSWGFLARVQQHPQQRATGAGDGLGREFATLDPAADVGLADAEDDGSLARADTG